MRPLAVLPLSASIHSPGYPRRVYGVRGPCAKYIGLTKTRLGEL